MLQDIFSNTSKVSEIVSEDDLALLREKLSHLQGEGNSKDDDSSSASPSPEPRRKKKSMIADSDQRSMLVSYLCKD